MDGERDPRLDLTEEERQILKLAYSQTVNVNDVVEVTLTTTGAQCVNRKFGAQFTEGHVYRASLWELMYTFCRELFFDGVDLFVDGEIRVVPNAEKPAQP